MTIPSVPPTGLALLGAVARLLNSGQAAEDALAQAAELLRAGLPAERVGIWMREPNASTFRGLVAPAEEAGSAGPGPWRGRRAVPERPPEAERVHLVHEGEWLGVLDASVAPERRERAAGLLQVMGDVLAPYLASIELSEDLAHEVALRAREIESQRRFISLVIDTLPVGLYVVDRDYRIHLWNRKREAGTQGLPREDVMGRSVFDVLTRQPAGELKAEFDEVFRTGEIRQLELDVGSGAGRRTFRISKIPMRLEGDDVTHVLTLGEDVTRWRQAQQQVMQSEKLAAIGQLAAGVMHEINNPLATISVCVSALEARLEALARNAQGDFREYLQVIEKEVERCTRIVDGLLDFSRPKAARKRRLDLHVLLEETLFLLKHHKGFRKLQVDRSFDPGLPPVLGNGDQLTQVFIALALNAVDAMERGGRLGLRTSRADAEGPFVRVAIEDSGVGIPPEDLTRIFEPFYTTKPQGRGTGLGLSICYGIVAEHGGRITVESTPGRGSVFTVWLPVEGEAVRGEA